VVLWPVLRRRWIYGKNTAGIWHWKQQP